MLVGSVLNKAGRNWLDRFPECPPVSWSLKTEFHPVWLEFTLRTSDVGAFMSLDELDIAMQRTAMLAELALGERDMLIFANYEEPDIQEPLRLEPDWTLEGARLRRSFRWQHPYEDLDSLRVWSAYSGRTATHSEAGRRICSGLIRGSLTDVIWATETGDVIFAPHARGVDIFAFEMRHREALQRRFSDWLTPPSPDSKAG